MSEEAPTTTINLSDGLYFFSGGDCWMQYGNNGAVRHFMDGRWWPDDPYWDVPGRGVDVDEPVYVQLSREMIHDGYGSGKPLAEFIGDIEKIAAKAKGHPVFARYDQESDYEGGCYYYLQIGYERPPNKKERAERKALNARVAERDAARAAKAAEREREEFERLKAKYDSDSDGTRSAETA